MAPGATMLREFFFLTVETMFKRILWGVMGVLIALFVVISLPISKVGEALFPIVKSLESSQAKLSTRIVQVGDTKLHVYVNDFDPARETVVLLHGYSSDRFIFVRFAKHLTAHYNLVIPDLAGHGDNAFDDSISYAATAQARRVNELLQELGISKAHIAGNSMGGLISAHYALLYPDQTLSIAVIDPAGVTAPEESDMFRMLAQGRNPFEIESRSEFAEFYEMTMHRPPYMPASVLAAIAEDYIARRPELKIIHDHFHDSEPLDGLLGNIKVPSLVIWGDKDRLLDVSAAPIWGTGIRDSTVLIFQDIGHMPQFEVPKESAASYRAFLEARR